jgi:hypothetical protein
MAQAIGNRLSIEQIQNGANELVRKNKELMEKWRQLSLHTSQLEGTRSHAAKSGDRVRNLNG